MATRVPFSDLREQYGEVRDEFLERLERICERAEFVLSGPVAEFENAFAEYSGSAWCVGLNSGTDALVLALRALGIEAGDEVIVPANSFIATAEAVSHVGARPLLVDVDPATKNIDAKLVEERIGRATRAVIPVHLFGNPAPMDDIVRVARARGLHVVEDACQAHGARYCGARVGSLGDLAAFSFYPGKNLGAFGDGGAVIGLDLALEERLRRLRNHGGLRRYEHDLVGYNSRLDALQAAALLCKLPHLDARNRARRAAAALYREALRDLAWLRLPEETPQSEPVYHLFVVELVDPGLQRDALLEHLVAHGIECGVHYPKPIHLTPAFRHLGHGEGEFPVAERAARTQLSLPMHGSLDAASVAHVEAALRAFVA